jgi:hypothetical protein
MMVTGVNNPRQYWLEKMNRLGSVPKLNLLIAAIPFATTP